MIQLKGLKFKRKKRKAKKVNKNRAGKVKRKKIIAYPAKLVRPVGKFLQARLKLLERRKKEIEEEDPFSDTSRTLDNASPDTDAAEQFGHARTTAIREQIDRKMIQTRKALTRIRIGKYGTCEVCGELIDTDRLMVYPEATLCAKDARKKEKK
ncbi:TraR/DksA C4-type zinc finger protein [Patescibacteria group bacterium]|nr:TraR/DksA C4-type zinc finger protein [Patescibacteria group bacterium]